VVVFLAGKTTKTTTAARSTAAGIFYTNQNHTHRHTEGRKTATTKRNTGPNSSQEWARQENQVNERLFTQNNNSKVITTGIKQASA